MCPLIQQFSRGDEVGGGPHGRRKVSELSGGLFSVCVPLLTIARDSDTSMVDPKAGTLISALPMIVLLRKKRLAPIPTLLHTES